MLYQQASFTLPVTNRPMTDEAYEVAVGLRCADCTKRIDKTQCSCSVKRENYLKAINALSR